MILTNRDYEIVVSVGRFGRMLTGQIRDLHFQENSSKNACYRRLKILVRRKFLIVTERPLIGGNKGGSGQYVFSLGIEGKKLFDRGFYQKPRVRDVQHTLMGVDAFIALKRLEAGGRYEIAGYDTDADTWTTVGRITLRPDLHVEIADHELRRTLSFWLEIDTGSEGKRQLKEKLDDYWSVWNYDGADALRAFPLVVFLVRDKRRAKEIRWLISHQPAEAQQLFKVELLSDWPASVL